ncbi:hypothetical protein O6H91_04G003900 [Diphasiastrum complanatum]|uniref:Uncharacterized protein n=3 Tax=Diphasiastrum complanatum TaxID=34168 RepID=A0ACC2DU37_DIPCM|nr:hypothetical protein O6H91_Y340800 [Diphasiastrum complanatum]KAJ7557650.1 hypothetical protein O6H91_04G003900 [Diphasiastrum complanatum]
MSQRPLCMNRSRLIRRLIREQMEKLAWILRTKHSCFIPLLWFTFVWVVCFFIVVFARPNRDQFSSDVPPKSSFPLSQGIKKLPRSISAKMPLWQISGAEDDYCAGRYVYMHNMPKEFNLEMLENCRNLSLWTDMCRFTDNAGFGPPLQDSEGVFSNHGWFATHQFVLDVIFHHRMKQYSCLTNDSSKAAAIYVPFYAGIDIARYLWGANTTIRDHTSLAVVDWLQKQPQWKIMGGQDHFIVTGRPTWDFRRQTDQDNDWGNRLMLLPAAKNMTILMVEASPFHNDDFAIPYPTYFHPSRDIEIQEWQNRMRNTNRTDLFSFAGAPRPGIDTSIRGQIIDQCRNATHCMLLKCHMGASKCHHPDVVMKLFQSSVFCLQPSGDSYTRRSTFDSILAGCIPVFFDPFSAYTQYTWHLPSDASSYSVFIPEDDIRESRVSIENILLRYSSEQIQLLREKVIATIPGILYANPLARLETEKDAFDLTVHAVISRIANLQVSDR